MDETHHRLQNMRDTAVHIGVIELGVASHAMRNIA